MSSGSARSGPRRARVRISIGVAGSGLLVACAGAAADPGPEILRADASVVAPAPPEPESTVAPRAPGIAPGRGVWLVFPTHPPTRVRRIEAVGAALGLPVADSVVRSAPAPDGSDPDGR